MKTVDEKIKSEIAKQSKIDNRKFMEDTKSEDVLVIILKAHLYIERELIRTLTDTIVEEKVLRSTTFSNKLILANSLGMVDEFYGSIGKVNSIRNKFAHEIDYEFNDSVYEDLLSTLPKKEKDDFLSEYEGWKKLLYDGTIPEFNFKLQLLLSNIWFALVSCHAMAKTAVELRLKEKELELALKYHNDSENKEM